MDKIRILIADDRSLIRQSTRNIFEKETDFEVIAEAVSGDEAVRLATEFSPDVAIIDTAMPLADAVAATEGIEEVCPDAIVVLFTVLDSDAFIVSSLEAGAYRYLLKSVCSSELTQAVREACIAD